MLDPIAVARDFILTFEDGGSRDPARTHSLDRDDSGNWTSGVCGRGACVGSNHGVTARTLAAYHASSAANITAAQIRSLTIDEAARIAVALFYRQPGLNIVPFDPIIASVFDFGWGTGTHEAILMLQRLIGADPDGSFGFATGRAYVGWRAARGDAAAATAWANTREAFYRLLVAQKPIKAKYLAGWTRRTAHYRPGGPWWALMTAPALKAA